jgi:hypothetical protein
MHVARMGDNKNAFRHGFILNHHCTHLLLVLINIYRFVTIIIVLFNLITLIYLTKENIMQLLSKKFSQRFCFIQRFVPTYLKPVNSP